ncbi:MAG: hypothetical protein WD336_05265 [Trueperaceae bacterium]
MRSLRFLVAAWLIAGLGATAWAQDGYFPSAPGTTWTYDNGETQTLSGPRDVDGVRMMTLTHYMDGTPISEELLVYGGDGVISHGTAAGGAVMRYAPPLRVYPPPPLEPGDQWRSSTRVNGIDVTLANEVVGTQGVQTAAGRFNALLIRQTTLTSSGARTQLDLFFVPTVGVVRFVTQDGTQIDLIDMTR